MTRKLRLAICLPCGLAAALIGFDVVAVAEFRRESREVGEIARRVTEGAQTDWERVVLAAQHVAFEVPGGRPDAPFLGRALAPLKPSALQVLRRGGDCAYKARAFIVLLHHLGIEASKLALYSRETGEAVHAVARVETERGPCVVDLLYGLVLVDGDGQPIPLEALRAEPDRLEQFLDAQVAAEHPRAARYPRRKYRYEDTRTINWNKSAVSRALYRGLSAVAGKDAVDALPRPYLTEEPALMALAASGAAKAALLVLAIGLWWRGRRAGSTLPVTPGASPSAPAAGGDHDSAPRSERA